MNQDTASGRHLGRKEPYFVLMIGRPGSGKGTQSILLAQSLAIAHICTGDLLRSSQNLELRAFADSGANLPDSLAVSLVAERLTVDDCRNGAVLDGCARTLGQAKLLHQALIDTNRRIGPVFVLDISEQEARSRIEQRRSFERIQRGDDDIETVNRRLLNYVTETTAAIEYFGALGFVEQIDATQSPQMTHESIMRRLASF